MRSLKMLSLAAVAACATAALTGTSIASASVVLCSTNTNPCTGTKAPAGTLLVAELAPGTESLLLTSLGTVKCTTSVTEGGLDETEGSTLLMGTQTVASFSGCTFKGAKCTVKTEDKPYLALLLKLATGEWHIVLHEKISGKPKALVDCGAESLKCVFGHTELLFTWLQSDPPTEPHALLHINQELEKEVAPVSSARLPRHGKLAT